MLWRKCGLTLKHLGKFGKSYMNQKFWKNKKVFVTGHTGFKGSWLCLVLKSLGFKFEGELRNYYKFKNW
mgnify:CR=1 FL=1